ncbi:ABC transporter permease [Mycoplasma marinum]|uniref:ABC transmembrane type-1 domain-containing protein n=1 Tax=Mycoplasma marinum TaxID=1937190 RepID=A0A4V2NI87_9MOLU|nr:ABC transporter permease [Mycoplasma marinum]TCG11418.1 hypothetical protein C4B24_01965 [Mycoplasma marinum]
MNKIETLDGEYNLPILNKKWFNSISAEEYEKKSQKNMIYGKQSKVWKDVIKRFFKNKWNIVALSVLSLIILFLIFGGLLTRHPNSGAVSKSSLSHIKFLGPDFTTHTRKVTGTLSFIKNSVDGSIKYIPPTGGAKIGTLQGDNGIIISSVFDNADPLKPVWNIEYKNPNYVSTPLGTDSIGISVFSRLVASSRFSIGLAVLVTTIESIIGTTIGLYLGYNAGKWLDTYFMRIVEVFTTIPATLLITILIMILGRGFGSILLALIIIGWTAPVYVARMFTIKVKDSEFIKASQSIGATQNKIIFKHILPNVFGRVIVSFVHRIPAVIFIEAFLVFLGLKIGGDAHNTLGNLLEESRKIDAMTSNPYFLISAASVVLLFTLSLQIISNGLRDSFDAKVSS